MLKTSARLWSVCMYATILFLLGSTCDSQEDPGAAKLDSAQIAAIRTHISSVWDLLTRSMTDCKTVVDPKLAGGSVLYLPAEFAAPPTIKHLEQDCHVQVKRLPTQIHGPGEVDTAKFAPHGLLYLENPYVVPGGFFNEMYGWDSYFIIRGLVSDGRIALACGMVENLFFEIEHYGTILNANRTYYLTRSQPPFLASMVLSVYEAEKAAGKPDNAWLDKAYGYVRRDYAMWTRAPHLAGTTGLPPPTILATALRPKVCRTKGQCSGKQLRISQRILTWLADMSRNAKRAKPGAYTIPVTPSKFAMQARQQATRSASSKPRFT